MSNTEDLGDRVKDFLKRRGLVILVSSAALLGLGASIAPYYFNRQFREHCEYFLAENRYADFSNTAEGRDVHRRIVENHLRVHGWRNPSGRQPTPDDLVTRKTELLWQCYIVSSEEGIERLFQEYKTGERISLGLKSDLK